MRTERRTADELGVGALVLYTEALYYVGAEYRDDSGAVIGIKLVPILSDRPPINCDLTRNPGYRFKYITSPMFAVEPCGDEDDEIVAVAYYDFTHREVVAAGTESALTPSGALVLDCGDVVRYGDFIGLIDTGDGFEYRIISAERLAKHYVLDFTEAD